MNFIPTTFIFLSKFDSPNFMLLLTYKWKKEDKIDKFLTKIGIKYVK